MFDIDKNSPKNTFLTINTIAPKNIKSNNIYNSSFTIDNDSVIKPNHMINCVLYFKSYRKHLTPHKDVTGFPEYSSLITSKPMYRSINIDKYSNLKRVVHFFFDL